MKGLHHLEDLRTRLQARLMPGQVEDIRICDSLPSTNALLMALPFGTTAAAPVLCWALHQTAGRGRRGRQWFSEPAQSLTFSLAFETVTDPQRPAATLSPASGLALARALDTLSPGVRVKWPNDLWRDQRKIAGVLLEATQRGRLQRVVIGVGVNLHRAPDAALTPELGPARAAKPQTPGGLFDRPANEDQRLDVLACAVQALCRTWQEHHDEAGRARRFADWTRLDALADQPVNLYNDAHCIASGRIAGVAPDGALLLNEIHEGRTVTTRHEIGELSLRADA